MEIWPGRQDLVPCKVMGCDAFIPAFVKISLCAGTGKGIDLVVDEYSQGDPADEGPVDPVGIRWGGLDIGISANGSDQVDGEEGPFFVGGSEGRHAGPDGIPFEIVI